MKKSENGFKNYRVRVYYKGEQEFEGVIRSKTPHSALANVFTNRYKGPVDSVEIKQVKVVYQEVEDNE